MGCGSSHAARPLGVMPAPEASSSSSSSSSAKSDAQASSQPPKEQPEAQEVGLAAATPAAAAAPATPPSDTIEHQADEAAQPPAQQTHESSETSEAKDKAAPVAAPAAVTQPAAAAPSPSAAAAHAGQSVASLVAAAGKPRQAPPRLSPAVPLSVLTDSYKAAHFAMYPDAQLMVAYGEFRAPFRKDASDTRFVFYGMRYLIENFIGVRWTEADVEAAAAFYSTHNAGFTPFPFPKDLFLDFVRTNDGYFPVRIESLREGSVANIHTPVYQIFAMKQYARLVTFLETILTQLWYPTTVATLSRRTKELIAAAFDQSVDNDARWLLDSRLHDFGMRGCTSVEQTVLGGVAHLLNFTGSDTMSAAYYAQYTLNGGKPVATSIPATEHSVMTSWPSERAAMQNMVEEFGGEGKVFACVMDSYDYDNALHVVMPQVAEAHKAKGGLMVLRPDSGDPVECIEKALLAGEKTFGCTVNKKGFKVLKGVAAIQGDGINSDTVKAILASTLKLGFSAQNVAFGMGGGLLQKVDRDTMSFATKLNYIVYADGKHRSVMKRPKTDGGKFSLPGILQVRREAPTDGASIGPMSVYPRAYDERVDPAANELQVVYDHGPVDVQWEQFDAVRARVEREWHATPKTHDPISQPMREAVNKWCDEFDAEYEQMIKGEPTQQQA